MMDPLKVSAQFAAYVWYCDHPGHEAPCERAAARFARANWPAFRSAAHEGVGRLLIEMAGARTSPAAGAERGPCQPAGFPVEKIGGAPAYLPGKGNNPAGLGRRCPPARHP
jgi:hypothetical protein